MTLCQMSIKLNSISVGFQAVAAVAWPASHGLVCRGGPVLLEL